MALSPVLFKFSEILFLDYQSQDIISHITVAGSANFGFSPELAEQMSGPSNFPIETEVSTISTEASLTLRNFDPGIMRATMDAVTREYLQGGAGANAYDHRSVGLITDIENLGGAALINPASSDSTDFQFDIIDDVSADALKAGVYRFEVTDAATKTWQLKSIGSPELLRTDFVKPDERIVAEGTGDATGIPDDANDELVLGKSGVKLIKSATTSTLADGVAIFRVIPPGQRAFTQSIGQENLAIPKLKIRTISRRMSDGRFGELFAYNCIMPGVNFNFGDDFSETEITGKLIFDNVAHKVADFTYYQK